MGDGLRKTRTVVAGLLALIGFVVATAPASATMASAGTTFPVSWLPIKSGEIPGTQAGSLGMGNSFNPMSDNGRFVLFAALSNLLDPAGAIDGLNVYRRDMQTGKSILVSRRDGKNGTAASGFVYSFDMSANGNLAVLVTEEKLIWVTTGGPTLRVKSKPSALQRSSKAMR